MPRMTSEREQFEANRERYSFLLSNSLIRFVNYLHSEVIGTQKHSVLGAKKARKVVFVGANFQAGTYFYAGVRCLETRNISSQTAPSGVAMSVKALVVGRTGTNESPLTLSDVVRESIRMTCAHSDMSRRPPAVG